uniref:PCI domain-containing protein n=1 Tax=Ditylum brightwellii TaxID=49249 RepID=A0A6S9I8K8_9STRA|mmetsp:Transcript_26075/g.34659  ORF Transcript_26075/g.34659 Transcript_26075/m.34659 type:complete len:445 (-) Transcript_26075:162-1496(-)
MGGNKQEDDTSSMDVDTPTPAAPVHKKKKGIVTPSASSETASKYPDMSLAQSIHALVMMASTPGGAEPKLDAEGAKAAGIADDLNSTVMAKVGGSEVENPSLYRQLKSTLQWEGQPNCLSEEELNAMEESHTKKLSELEEKVEDASENAGDMEVLEARFDVARFAAKSLSKEAALEAYDKVLNLPKLSSGKTIDALMESARVASFHGDTKKGSELIDRAAKMAADGGDWDRRNRLKVYSALSKLLARDVKEASTLLVDCIATFSCTELCSYTDFIVYTMISGVLYLPRTELKKMIIDGPEILSVAKDIPAVNALVNALYDCDYKGYLHAMVDVQPVLVADRFLQPHSGYIMRELHVLGYKQFLDSYKSVTLESMASSFGVSTAFLDMQLSRFIAAGRLTAKIDKFGGVVETNRPDLKNAQYRDMIQKGDLLLNRIQKLGRVVDL